MNKDNILKQIEKLKLNNLNKRTVVNKLAKIYNLSLEKMYDLIEELENDGSLFVDKKGKIGTPEYFGFKKGVLNANPRGFAFCVVENSDDDVFIANPNLNGALHGDTVIVKVAKNKKDGREEGFVLKILSHGLRTVVGTIQVFEKFSFVVPDNKKIFKDVFIPKNMNMCATTGEKVFVKINSFEGKNLKGEVIEILGKNEGDVTTDVLSIIRSYELIEEFSPELLDIAKSIPQTIDVNKYSKRRDLRDKIVFTIDGDDSKDFDDAVSLETENDNYKLSVHIADVGEYVKVGSKLDKEAFDRATSVYFPNCVLPMLPVELSNGICSLNPHENRLALTCEMVFDQDANMLSHEIYESLICSTERMTYNNVTKIVEGDEELSRRYANIKPTILKMVELHEKLEKKRFERGSIDFDVPEPKIVLDPETLEVVKLEQKPRTVSEKLIESFMLAANETVAEHFEKLKIPFVYRIHEAPDNEKIDGFNSFVGALGIMLKGKAEKLTPKEIQDFMGGLEDGEFKDVINKVLLRCMQKAKYSPECLGHFGLAAKYYCHFTSPIRRYPDLTIHRIIKQYLHDELNSKTLGSFKNFVDLSSKQSSTKEVSAEKAERDVDDYFKARYMLDKVGAEFDGVISSVTGFGMFVELENTIEGMISIISLPGDNYVYNDKFLTLSNGLTTFKLGDRIKIKVQNVNLQDRKIDFVLADSNKTE